MRFKKHVESFAPCSLQPRGRSVPRNINSWVSFPKTKTELESSSAQGPRADKEGPWGRQLYHGSGMRACVEGEQRYDGERARDNNNNKNRVRPAASGYRVD